MSVIIVVRLIVVWKYPSIFNMNKSTIRITSIQIENDP